MHTIIVGAGFWGAVIAERMASVLGCEVTIIDERAHIGGNCHSSLDEETGIECHRYGSHIFHTSSEEVWNYINRFSAFNGYQHKVFTMCRGKVYTMPINLSTIESFYGRHMTPSEAEAFLQAEIARDRTDNPANLEEKAISLIGRPLYEAFIQGYTQKQWEHDPRLLPANIITRLPFRTSYNANYFSDPWQGVPVDGYFKIFERMLDNPRITLKLETSFESVQGALPKDTLVVYTGLPDRLFNYRFGELEWRSLRFEWEVVPVRDWQGTAVMNYADRDVPYTRIHEFKHYHPERTVPMQSAKSVICREYSRTWHRGDEAYYPVNDEKNNALYARYQAEAAKNPNLILGGRLGAYRYWDMDKAIADALTTFREKIAPRFGK